MKSATTVEASASSHTISYRVTRTDRASAQAALAVGSIVYPGRDAYGCAAEDTRNFDMEFIAISLKKSGEPFCTIPRADVELLSDEERS